jgi:manganese transport protein
MNAAAGLLSRGASGLKTGWWPAFRVAFGPGALVAVGYMDPGNWATDIGAGSQYGYDLLAVVLLASLTAMLLQGLAVRLGIATGEDLAQACRRHYSRRTSMVLWGLCQIAIVACDMAEIVGTAIALDLLFGLPLLLGVCCGAVGTLLILLLEQSGRRRLEATIVVLSLTVAVCIFIDVALAQPSFADAFAGLVPGPTLISDPGQLLLAVGIIGATVMPHNLYLHSALVVRSGPRPARGPTPKANGSAGRPSIPASRSPPHSSSMPASSSWLPRPFSRRATLWPICATPMVSSPRCSELRSPACCSVWLSSPPGRTPR